MLKMSQQEMLSGNQKLATGNTAEDHMVIKANSLARNWNFKTIIM